MTKRSVTTIYSIFGFAIGGIISVVVLDMSFAVTFGMIIGTIYSNYVLPNE